MPFLLKMSDISLMRQMWLTYRMPFVREPDGGRHSEMEGIRRLAKVACDPMAGAGRRADGR